MPLFSLSWALLVFAGALLLVGRRAVKSPKEEASSAWRVETKATSDFVTVTFGRYRERVETIDVNGTVQVRLVGRGATVLIATVALAEDDYEQQINDAIGRAEERAMTLNALVPA